MKHIRRIVCFACIGLGFALTLPAEEIHPDWADLVARAGTGRIRVADGETWVAYDADLDEIAKLGAGKLELPSTSTLVLDNVTQWLTTNVFYSSVSTGRLVKRGNTSVEQLGNMYSFHGTLELQGGVLKQSSSYLVSGMYGCHVIIRDGATLDVNTTISHGDIVFEIAGDGSNGQGAIIVTKSGAGLLGQVSLSDDATIAYDAAIGTTAFSPYDNKGSGQAACVDRPYLALNGHVLTLAGVAPTFGFNNVDFVGGGTVRIAGAVARTLALSNTNDFGTTTFDVRTDVTLTSGNWNAPFDVAEGRTLFLSPNATAGLLEIGGAITGAGSVSCGTAAAKAKGCVILSDTCSAAGGIDVNGNDVFRLKLRYPLADYGKLTVTSGEVDPLPGLAPSGASRWSADDVLAYAQARGQTSIDVDVTEATNNAALNITSADVLARFPATPLTWGALGAGGWYTLSGPFAEANALNLDVQDGMVRLSGEKTINLGSVAVGGTGTLKLDGAKDVVFADQTLVANGHVVITNSSLRSTHHELFKDFATGALFVGQGASGVLTIEDGASVSNRLIVGGGASSYSSGSGVGAVRQHGGSVLAYAANANYPHLSSNLGVAGHGSYTLSGGTFGADGTFTIGGYSSCKAVFIQKGGSVNFPGPVSILYGNNANQARAAYAVLGGRTEMTGGSSSGGNLSLITATGGQADLTVEGPGSVLSIAKGKTGLVYFGNQADQDSTMLVNFNDEGVFELAAFYAKASSYSSDYPIVLNFDGGVLKSSATVYHKIFNSGSLDPKVVVYDAGIVIDSNGYDIENAAGSALTAEKEGGVREIRLAEPLPGFSAVPYVRITGSGHGASALAFVDETTDCVTNIHVTSHGWGYTEGETTVELLYVGTVKHTVPAADVIVGANDVGGLTKRGEGTLTLYGANAFEKWTRIEGGTLKVGAAGAIPSGTLLTVAAGATLDLGNDAVTFTGVTADSAGTVKNGTVTVSGTWPIDFGAIPSAGTLSADVVFTGSTIAFAGTPDPEVDSYTLLRVANGKTMTGVPAASGLPDGWSLRVRGNELRVRRNRGFVLIFR